MAITARHGYVTAVITAVLKARFPTLARQLKQFQGSGLVEDAEVGDFQLLNKIKR